MKIVAMTDVGKVRDNNEDAYIVLEDDACYIICDGMGGHQAGEIAAQMATEKIAGYIKREQITKENFEVKIEKMLKDVNAEIIAYASENENCKNMGTTVVLALIRDGKLCVANVGDSRCYIQKDNVLMQVSKDHSLVAELVKIGSISEEEAVHHPDRNIITSALGVDEKFQIYSKIIDLDNINMVLLCTDGLTNMINVDEIIDKVNHTDFENLAKALTDYANEKGGLDNITVICIEI